MAHDLHIKPGQFKEKSVDWRMGWLYALRGEPRIAPAIGKTVDWLQGYDHGYAVLKFLKRQALSDDP